MMPAAAPREQAEVVVDEPPVLPLARRGLSARKVEPVPQARSTMLMAECPANAAATASITVSLRARRS